MKVDFITHSFKEFNEDGHGRTQKSFWVLDGASALNTNNYTNESNDVYWVVNWWNRYLEEHLDDTNKSIAQIIEAGVHKLNSEFSSFVKLSTLSKLDVVSLGIAVTRINNEFLEVFVLGDVEINIKSHSGDFLTYTDYSINKLDQEVINKMASNKLRHEQLVFKDFTQDELDLLRVNRSSMNSKDGYKILEHDPDVIKYAIQDKIKLNNLEEIMLYSDGYAQMYNKFTLAEVFEESKRKGLEQVVLELRDREKKDHSMIRYQRLKKHDDVTAIRIALK